MAVSFTELRQTSTSELARRAWWHLLSVGTVWRDEVERHEGADKAGLHLFWVQRGSGWLELPEGRCELKAGPRCWLVDLRQPRSYVPLAGRRLVTQGFRFSGPLVHGWLELLGGAGEIGLSVEAMERLRTMHRLLVRQSAKASRLNEWHTHGRLTEMWGDLMAARGVLRDGTVAAPEPVQRVLEAVLARPAHHWQAVELAELARVSYSGLRVMFRTARGETLHDFLQTVRLDQAYALLADARLSVKQVAAQIDFRSETYFTHWFRRHTGHAPGIHRKAQRG